MRRPQLAESASSRHPDSVRPRRRTWARALPAASIGAVALLGLTGCVPPVAQASHGSGSTTTHPVTTTAAADPTTATEDPTTAPTATTTTTTTTTAPVTTTSPTTAPGTGQPDPAPGGAVPAPGQVGYRGSTAALTVIDGPGSAPAGTTWTSGALRISTNDVTLDHVFVKGGIDYSGNGTLTIRNSVVEGAAPAWSSILARSGVLDVRDTTIRWRGGAPGPTWGNGTIHGDARMTVIRCDISGAVDGVQNGPGNSLFEQNYIHDLAMLGTYPNNTHNDGIQSYGGPGLVIRNNRIDIRDAQGRAYDGTHQNGAVFIQPSDDSVSVSPQIVGNFLVGGGYTLRLEGPMTGAVVSGNTFGPTTGGFGSVLADKSGVSITTWSGNVTEGGQAVPRP